MCVPSCNNGLSVDHSPNTDHTQDTCYKFWPDKEMTPDVYGFVGVVMKQVIQYNGFTAYVCDICNEAQVCMHGRVGLNVGWGSCKDLRIEASCYRVSSIAVFLLINLLSSTGTYIFYGRLTSSAYM